MANSFFDELKRRNVFKVSAGYILLGWLVLQVADVVVPILELPEWTLKLVLFIGILGFPFAIFFAWAYELTPDGIKLESDVEPDESVTASTGQKLNLTIIALLVIALGYYVFNTHFNQTSTSSTSKELEQSVTDAALGSSIAVLPFVNMSSDVEQEYFSDGMSEEILNILAKIPNLKVTSRSSAFSYKGKDIILSQVAKQLGVRNILEGSVRKSGNKVRITAQLIDAVNDQHLWSETYDRELIDIFVIQDEISKAIVSALKTNLGIESQLVSRDMSNVNLEAHNEYLKGRYHIEKRTLRDLNIALNHFENSITIDQNYAPAWMGKAWAELFLRESAYGETPNDVAIANARVSIEKAIAIDPRLSQSFAVKGLIEAQSNNNEVARLNFERAIELNPNNANAYNWYAASASEKALELREKAYLLDPLSIIINHSYGDLLRRIERYDKATEIANRMLDIDVNHHLPYSLLSNISSNENKPALAIYYQQKAVQLNPTIPRKENLMQRFFEYELLDEVTKIWTGTVFYEPAKAYIQKDFELQQSLISQIFPRFENDYIGHGHRANAELLVGNYDEAIKYYTLAGTTTGGFVIYAHQKAGNLEIANNLIEAWKQEFDAYVKAGNDRTYWMAANIAFAENDIDTMIKQLSKVLSDEPNNILNHNYAHRPMYQSLREHPKWSALNAESDRRKKLVRDDFYKLLDQDVIQVAREHQSFKSNEKVAIEVSESLLMEYVGFYRLTPTFGTTVSVENGELYMQGQNQVKFRVVAESEDRFFSVSHNDVFTFQRDESDTVISMIEHDRLISQKYMKELDD